MEVSEYNFIHNKKCNYFFKISKYYGEYVISYLSIANRMAIM